jgi:hypothetical protein
MRLGRGRVAAHSIRAVAVLTDGSRLVDTVRTEAAGFAPVVDVELVQVAATVTDGKGRPVKGLGREAFRVFEDGRKQDVTHFIGADGERELVVAVDMSGSMGPAMARCRDAVKRFLGSIRPIDAVTVLAFNDSVFTVSRPRPRRGCARSTASGPGGAPPSTMPCCGASISWSDTGAGGPSSSSRTGRTWSATRRRRTCRGGSR